MLGTRENLDVFTRAEVRRVLFDGGKSGMYTAKGVELETEKGELLEARLREPGRGSVVLTAGALGTPKILMNSGVGDRAKLKKAGIPLVLNHLPGVGQNLQDHPVIPVTFRLGPELAARVAEAFGGGGFEELSNYAEWVRSGGGLLKRGGAGSGGAGAVSGAAAAPLAHTASHSFPPKPQTPYLVFASTSFTAGAFLRSDKGSKNPKLQDEYPDIQLTVFPRVTEPHLVAQKKQSQQANSSSDSSTSTSAGDNDDGGGSDAANKGAADDKDMLVTVALLDPEARYSVELDAADPARGPVRLQELHFPAKEGGGLLSELDVAKLVWGLRQVRVIAKTFPLNQVRGGLGLEACGVWDWWVGKQGSSWRSRWITHINFSLLDTITSTPKHQQPRPPRKRPRRGPTSWTRRPSGSGSGSTGTSTATGAAPPRWATRTSPWRWWTAGCACTTWRDYGWRTRPSSPRSPRATRTAPCCWWRRAGRT